MTKMLGTSASLVLMSRGLMSAPESGTSAAALVPGAQTPEELTAGITAAIEAAVIKAVGASAGPIPAFAVNLLIGQIVEPIVGTLMTIVTHIGMAVPSALGELVEKIEGKIHLDLNGDGFTGDPKAAVSSSGDAK